MVRGDLHGLVRILRTVSSVTLMVLAVNTSLLVVP